MLETENVCLRLSVVSERKALHFGHMTHHEDLCSVVETYWNSMAMFRYFQNISSNVANHCCQFVGSVLTSLRF